MLRRCAPQSHRPSRLHIPCSRTSGGAARAILDREAPARRLARPLHQVAACDHRFHLDQRCASCFPTTTAISRRVSNTWQRRLRPRAQITVVAPERDRSRCIELPHARPPADGAACRQRLPVRQWHAYRLCAPRGNGPARRIARHGDLGHQPGRQHGRRHHLLGYRGRRHRRLPPGVAVDCDVAGLQDRGALRNRSSHRCPAGRAPCETVCPPVAVERQCAGRCLG